MILEKARALKIHSIHAEAYEKATGVKCNDLSKYNDRARAKINVAKPETIIYLDGSPVLKFNDIDWEFHDGTTDLKTEYEFIDCKT